MSATFHPLGHCQELVGRHGRAMRTIPAEVAAVLLAARPDLRDVVRPFGRKVGARVEVDLDGVGGVCPELCRSLERYHWQTSSLWAQAASGAGGGRFICTRRCVADAQQVTGKVNRRDLTAELEALGDLPQTAQVVDALLESTVDEEALAQAVAGAGGELDNPEPGVRVVRVPISGQVMTPGPLGGASGVAEVGRTVTITARHAGWRDRRVRRLARVQVHVQEVWADPRAAMAELPAA